MTKLPDVNRVPENLEGMDIVLTKGYTVASWCPLPDGKVPSTQVHLVLEMPIKGKLVLRLKTKEAVNTLIKVLERHRNDVWP
ncbi:hypothetical protein LCGC14_1363210 [marine sediment metagenome]|uniref:Uncharacterized protein n=1 Tax=marine sediment metagenome TaxID=412755 RepID=A0A0F9K812_9ZZZZ